MQQPKSVIPLPKDTADSNQRYAICETCPEFFNLTKQCKKCGCFMPAKTRLKSAKCPLGKW